MIHVKGDLILLAQQGKFDVIIHGCNCFRTMGAGIAAQIRQQYPQAYAVDCQTEKGDRNKLGTLSVTASTEDNPFFIVNMYTQYGFNPTDKPCDYQAIRKGFKTVNRLFNGLRIGYPMIGAGLAGGDWEIISEIINQELTDCQHTFVEWDN